eukprot:249415-Chlamydomonas_euryale.AAC.3
MAIAWLRDDHMAGAGGVHGVGASTWRWGERIAVQQLRGRCMASACRAHGGGATAWLCGSCMASAGQAHCGGVAAAWSGEGGGRWLHDVYVATAWLHGNCMVARQLHGNCTAAKRQHGSCLAAPAERRRSLLAATQAGGQQWHVHWRVKRTVCFLNKQWAHSTARTPAAS